MHLTITFSRRGAVSKALSRGEYSRRNSVLLQEHLKKEKLTTFSSSSLHPLFLFISILLSLSLSSLFLPLTSVPSDCAAVAVFCHSLKSLNYSPATAGTRAVSYSHACTRPATRLKILPSNTSCDHHVTINMVYLCG